MRKQRISTPSTTQINQLTIEVTMCISQRAPRLPPKSFEESHDKPSQGHTQTLFAAALSPAVSLAVASGAVLFAEVAVGVAFVAAAVEVPFAAAAVAVLFVTATV